MRGRATTGTPRNTLPAWQWQRSRALHPLQASSDAWQGHHQHTSMQFMCMARGSVTELSHFCFRGGRPSNTPSPHAKQPVQLPVTTVTSKNQSYWQLGQRVVERVGRRSWLPVRGQARRGLPCTLLFLRPYDASVSNSPGLTKANRNR